MNLYALLPQVVLKFTIYHIISKVLSFINNKKIFTKANVVILSFLMKLGVINGDERKG